MERSQLRSGNPLASLSLVTFWALPTTGFEEEILALLKKMDYEERTKELVFKKWKSSLRESGGSVSEGTKIQSLSCNGSVIGVGRFLEWGALILGGVCPSVGGLGKISGRSWDYQGGVCGKIHVGQLRVFFPDLSLTTAQSCWTLESEEGPSPSALKAKLKIWNREVFGNITARKESALKQMMFWVSVEGDRVLSAEEQNLRKQALEEYKKCVIMEETSWRQNSRELCLRRETEILVFHSLLLETMSGGPDAMCCRLGSLKGRCSNTRGSFSEEEVSLSDLNGDKAPGPYSFSMAIQLKFSEGVLANRLKKVMGKIVSKSQNAFVEGRQILDASLIANEAIDSMQKSGGGGILSMSGLKVNLDKSEIISMGRVENVEDLALEFGCKECEFEIGADPKGFSLGGGALEREPHLVDWSIVCLDKRKGGLGVRNLALLNKALLCKWSCPFAVEREALWRQVVCAKYGEEEGGWRSCVVRGSFGVGLWKAIRRVWDVIGDNMVYSMGNGRREAWVEDVWSHFGGGVWAPRFSRRLNDWEVFDVKRFLLGQGRRVYSDVEDQVVWTKAKDGRFSVKSI
ncbi:hypothetical protein CK203_110732 [Vitis vinifera]|uniref:Reverse transcriptase domain-containing protein n=1 Tax=Vitis vinifera TaxID=29760 RepID=A0A438FG78_VITVI|nr:hypothetical protein CK203_110732 [Vitis vinifera]